MNLRVVLALIVFSILGSTSALASSIVTDNCGYSCFELVPYGDYYLKRERDKNGEIFKAEETNIPSDVVFELVGEQSRDSNDTPPLPPPGGTGSVTRTVIGPGVNEGVTGTWTSSTSWFFQNRVITRVVNTTFFTPGGDCPEWDPCTVLQ